MIDICPFCGSWLDRILLHEGITTCPNCNRVFENSLFNRMLSASWSCRKNNLSSALVIKIQYELDDSSINLIQKYICDGSFSHDEFFSLVKTIFEK